VQGYIISKFPKVFHSIKSAHATLKGSKMQPKNKARLKLIQLQSVYNGKKIWIYIMKKKEAN